jgi:two-component system sensor histidine kinase RegB
MRQTVAPAAPDARKASASIPPMLYRASRPLLRVLCNLRWLAIAGQALTIWLVTGPLQIALPALPLWAGVGALALFNVYATLRARGGPEPVDGEVFGHMLVDVVVLAWMVGFSGGIENPFSSLFLLPIAFSILALPGRWVLAMAVASIGGYVVSALLARPLPHVHGTFGDAFSLHKLGMLVNFLVSAVVVLGFLTRIAADWRRREREVARLRERFARNEGILALATHAASVAHELNTPLGTMTLMVEEMAAEAGESQREDFTTLHRLLDVCRDRVRELASPAEAGEGSAAGIDLDRVIERWRLVRPTVDLRRSGSTAGLGRIDPAVGHLIQALLNNAADASGQAGVSQVDLHLAASGRGLSASIRDYGPGLDEAEPLLPGRLFRTSKPGGMGIGLALSHATVERLGGTLSMRPAPDGRGVVVSFELPVVEAA